MEKQLTTFTEEQQEKILEYVQNLIDQNLEFVKSDTWICGETDDDELRFKICSDCAVSDIPAADYLEKYFCEHGFTPNRYRDRGLHFSKEDTLKILQLNK